MRTGTPFLSRSSPSVLASSRRTSPSLVLPLSLPGSLMRVWNRAMTASVTSVARARWMPWRAARTRLRAPSEPSSTSALTHSLAPSGRATSRSMLSIVTCCSGVTWSHTSSKTGTILSTNSWMRALWSPGAVVTVFTSASSWEMLEARALTSRMPSMCVSKAFGSASLQPDHETIARARRDETTSLRMRPLLRGMVHQPRALVCLSPGRPAKKPSGGLRGRVDAGGDGWARPCARRGVRANGERGADRLRARVGP